MIEKLTAFKRRLRYRRRKVKRMQFNEWWSTILSTLAFLISAYGLYVNSLQKLDDLRVFPPTAAGISVERERVSAAIKKLTFVNAGNQSESVQKVFWVARLGNHEPQRPDSCYAASDEISTSTESDLESFEIKPGTEATKDINLSGFSRSLYMQLRDEDYLTVCLSFLILTPAELVRSKDIVVFAGRVGKDTANVFDFTDTRRVVGPQTISLVNGSRLR